MRAFVRACVCVRSFKFSMRCCTLVQLLEAKCLTNGPPLSACMDKVKDMDMWSARVGWLPMVIEERNKTMAKVF